MFSFSSLKVKKYLFASLVLVLLAAFLGGCDNNVGSDLDLQRSLRVPNGLVGMWVEEAGDWFHIERTAGTDTISTGWMPGEPDWSGTILQVIFSPEQQSGVIIIELDEFGYKDSKRPFTAVYFLNFMPLTSVSLNAANNENYPNWNPDTETKEEAINKFTFEKIDNYINRGIAEGLSYIWQL
jgi:hypothetical protein